VWNSAPPFSRTGPYRGGSAAATTITAHVRRRIVAACLIDTLDPQPAIRPPASRAQNATRLAYPQRKYRRDSVRRRSSRLAADILEVELAKCNHLNPVVHRRQRRHPASSLVMLIRAGPGQRHFDQRNPAAAACARSIDERVPCIATRSNAAFTSVSSPTIYMPSCRACECPRTVLCATPGQTVRIPMNGTLGSACSRSARGPRHPRIPRKCATMPSVTRS